MAITWFKIQWKHFHKLCFSISEFFFLKLNIICTQTKQNIDSNIILHATEQSQKHNVLLLFLFSEAYEIQSTYRQQQINSQ